MPQNSKSVKIKAEKIDLKTDVYNLKGEKTGKMTLPAEVFSLASNPALIAQAVRVYLENQRQGTRKVKSRGQVKGSSRKIYRQKGTGRARHGNIRAPIFVGGGVAHGPKIAVFKARLSQKMRRKALYVALSEKLQSEKIKVVNSFSEFPSKTKNMINLLNNLHLLDKHKSINSSILLVTENVNNSLFLASRNILDLTVTPITQINTYEVMKHQYLIFAKNAIDLIAVGKKEEQLKPVAAAKKTVVKKIIKAKTGKSAKTSAKGRSRRTSGKK